MRKRILAVIQYVFFLFIGLLLLWLVFRKLDPSEVAEEIRNARYGWLMLAIILGVLSHLARAVRWNILIRSLGYDTKTSTTFYAVMVGYLANTAFPRLGEVTRCGVLSKKTNAPFTALFGTVISERIFDFMVLVLIILGVIFFQLGFLKDFVDKYFISSITGMVNSRNLILALMGLALVLFLPLILFIFFIKQIRGWKIYQRASDFGKDLLQGIRTIQKIRHKGLFFLLTLVIWTLYTMMTYTVFFAIDDTSHLNFWDGVTVMALGSLGIVAPVPGGIGAYQFIVKAILVEIYLVAPEPAASFSVICWATQTFMIVALGIFSYYMLVFLKTDLNNDNTRSNTRKDLHLGKS